MNNKDSSENQFVDQKHEFDSLNFSEISKKLGILVKLAKSIHEKNPEMELEARNAYKSEYVTNNDIDVIPGHFKGVIDRNLSDVQTGLALLYLDGIGVKQDYNESLMWLKEAAALGNADAQYNAGIFYLNGIGVERDFERAVRFITVAAEQG